MNWLTRWFSPKKVEEVLPVVGKLYYRKTEPDPFASPYTIRVLDVQKGYVSYEFLGGYRSSLEIAVFNKLYGAES